MVFRWVAALCESMKPKSAHLADLVVAVAVAVVEADTAVVAVQTAVVVVVAAAHAAGNCLKASILT
jgi:hypothetical protein